MALDKSGLKRAAAEAGKGLAKQAAAEGKRRLEESGEESDGEESNSGNTAALFIGGLVLLFLIRNVGQQVEEALPSGGGGPVQ